MSASVPTPIPTGTPTSGIPTSGPIAITGPLTIPELLDRTFRALRARFGLLTLSAAIVMVPVGVLTTLLSGRFLTGYFELLQFSMTDPENADLIAEQFMGDMVGYFGAITLLVLLSMFGSTLVSLMSMFHIHRFLHGESSTVGEGLRAALRRLLPMIGMQILEAIIIGLITAAVAIGVGIVLALAALVLGGAFAALDSEAAGIFLIVGMVIVFIIGYILLILLLLAPTIIFMGRWLAAAPSLMIEELGPMQALQRSWTLTKGRMWRGILYLVLLTLFSYVVIGLPVGMAQWIAMISMPSQMALIGVISTVAGFVLSLFYQPFYATGTVLFYYDLRVRAEAYDVALRVAALEAEVTPNAPPA